MLTKHQDLLDLLLDIIKTEYADDVAVMFIYGSCVNGTANEKSDLDMIFIPKTKRGRKLAKAFILDGIGYDLWGASWGTLEKFARFDDMKVSVVADSRLVYCASEKDRQKYETLVNRAGAIAKGPLTRDLIRKAEDHFNKAKHYYDELRGEMHLVAVGGIMMELCNVVCLLNHTYLRFGCKRVIEELTALEKLPEDFISIYSSVIEHTETAQKNCAALISITEQFLQSATNKKTAIHRSLRMEKGKSSLISDFTGLYEEISSHWNKIRVSCANDDAMYAFFSAVFLQHDLDRVQESIEVPIPAFNFIDQFNIRNLSALVMAADKAELAFVDLLESKGVPIVRYDTLEQLRQSFA